MDEKYGFFEDRVNTTQSTLTISADRRKTLINGTLECSFGLIGAIFCTIFIVIAILLTPDYSIFSYTISSLAEGPGSFFYSLSFVSIGMFSCFFFLFIGRLLKNNEQTSKKKEFIRIFTTVLSLITSFAITCVAITPTESFQLFTSIFHTILAAIAFLGAVIFISTYSILMGKEKSFLKINYILGFIIIGVFIIFMGLVGWNGLRYILGDQNIVNKMKDNWNLLGEFDFAPFFEWLLASLILVWIFMNSIHLLKKY